MNFSIDRDVLLNSLIHVQRGLPNKTPLPILYAIKFEVFSDYLQLTSSNSDIAIQVLIDDKSLSVIKTGKVTYQVVTLLKSCVRSMLKKSKLHLLKKDY